MCAYWQRASGNSSSLFMPCAQTESPQMITLGICPIAHITTVLHHIKRSPSQWRWSEISYEVHFCFSGCDHPNEERNDEAANWVKKYFETLVQKRNFTTKKRKKRNSFDFVVYHIRGSLGEYLSNKDILYSRTCFTPEQNEWLIHGIFFFLLYFKIRRWLRFFYCKLGRIPLP